jgi:hypothetical protein
MPAWTIASQVRCSVRPTPVSPTTRQRVEARLRQALELHLAVAVGEEGEHEERQPVGGRLVEGAEHARRVLVAGAAAQELVRFLAPVAAEILLQQVDHRPEVAALLDIDLEQVAHVVERRRRLAEVALLLDRGRLGVALDDDEPAQHGAVLARHLLPGRLAEMLAEIDLAAFLLRRQEDAPAVFGHAHVIELRPAFRIDRDRGAQIDERLLEAFRPHVVPPVEIARMPALERFEHLPVGGEVDVVRDLGGVVDVQAVHFAFLSSSRASEARPGIVRSKERSARDPGSPPRGVRDDVISHTRPMSNAAFCPVP